MPEPLFATLTRRLHLGIRRQILEDVHAAGFTDIGAAHLYIFQLPGPNGLRPTELAERVNTTKQAINHHLRELEDRGYLHRLTSPVDGRARVVQLTARGRAVMTEMRASGRRIERRWASRFDRDRLEALRRELSALDEAIATKTH